MEKYTNIKKGTKTGLGITAVICLITLAFLILGLINAVRESAIFEALHCVCDIVIIALIACYAFIGFDKPHGNMLRVLFFIFGTYLAINGALIIANTQILSGFGYVAGACDLFAALIITYISGRLHKIEKNKKLLTVATILVIATNTIEYITVIPSISVDFSSISYMVSSLTSIVSSITLSFVYAARFEEHKAAGLEDK